MSFTKIEKNCWLRYRESKKRTTLSSWQLLDSALKKKRLLLKPPIFHMSQVLLASNIIVTSFWPSDSCTNAAFGSWWFSNYLVSKQDFVHEIIPICVKCTYSFKISHDLKWTLPIFKEIFSNENYSNLICSFSIWIGAQFGHQITKRFFDSFLWSTTFIDRKKSNRAKEEKKW